MIVRNLIEPIEGTSTPSAASTSRQLLLARDAIGFSLHDAVLNAGTRGPMRLHNHLEVVYCVEGSGELEDLSTSEVHPIRRGTVYALDEHDRHVLTAHTDLRVVCVCSPPLIGSETDRALLLPVYDPVPADLYASRFLRSWHRVAREDPCVYGEQPGPLSAGQIAQYAHDGLLVLAERVPQHRVEDLRTAADRVCFSARDEHRTIDSNNVVRSVFAVHGIEPFAGMVVDLAGIARQILGSDVYVHQSRIVYTPALDCREVPWHSDFEGWHVADGMPRMRALTAVIHLTESTTVNGPLLLVPGSHRTWVRCVGRPPVSDQRRSLRRDGYSVPPRDALDELARAGGIVPVTGMPGTVALFDCNTLNGSAGNPSPWPRTSLFVVFNSVLNPLANPPTDLLHCPSASPRS